jgi:acyl phosphate:glycerol-3-phosphate acyltransferase
MIDALLVSLTALVAYLVGAIPFGYLIARSRGVDLFAHGSGNIGATNVGRVLGRRFGILAFVLDFLKGALPTFAATLLDRTLRPNLPAGTLPVVAGLAAFLGHLFPVYLRFRGGKGVATGAGVVAVLVPLPTAGALLTWLLVVSSTRYVSLASLCAAAMLCALRLGLTPEPLAPEHRVLTLFCLWATALVFVRHGTNVRRLLAGTENRLKDSPAMNSLTRTLHVLAVGLWFGTAVFFTFVVGLSPFGHFEDLATSNERPLWFPRPKEYAGDPPSKKFPDPIRKEQGTRAAGFAISPMFVWYFAIQTVCAVVALTTALQWSRLPQKVHRVRSAVLALALVSVAGGWWLEQEVSKLQGPRDDLTEAVLKQKNPSQDEIQAAEQARSTFGQWHVLSMTANLIVLILVTVAMALAAHLPTGTEQRRTEEHTEPPAEVPALRGA